jgi:acyl dehydratase
MSSVSKPLDPGAPQLQWNLDGVEQWTEPARHEATRAKIVAYAEATGDEHPLHRSGDLAPPVFPVVDTLINSIAPAIMTVVPGEVAMRVVHGEQDFRYHRPIRPGDELFTRAAAVGVHGTSSGVVVLGKGITENGGGELVVEQYMAAFFRGVQLDVHVGESLTDHAFDESVRGRAPDATVTHGYDPDQTVRYSKASGDPMPIHLDDEIAKAMGLPGIIVHGLCTMAFCGRAVVQEFCPEDPTQLKRFAVRFSKIVQPSEKVTHSLWDTGAGRIVFETVSDNGNTAIKDGLAEIAR